MHEKPGSRRALSGLLFSLSVLCVSAGAQPAFLPPPPPARRIVIAASTAIDGKGHVLHNTRLVIQGSKIAAINPKAAPVDYDLRGLTVSPGWIDAHVHITWSFGKDGKNAGPGETTPEAA